MFWGLDNTQDNCITTERGIDEMLQTGERFQTPNGEKMRLGLGLPWERMVERAEKSEANDGMRIERVFIFTKHGLVNRHRLCLIKWIT